MVEEEWDLKSICQFCGATFNLLDIGEYVKHLIRAHWKLLVRVHDGMEKGEL